MNADCEQKIDDFFVDSLFYSESSFMDSDILLKYCDLIDSLPNKLKKSTAFNKWDFYNEIVQNKSLYRKNETSKDSLVIYWLSQVRKMATMLSMKEEVPELSFSENDLIELAHKSVDVSFLPEIATYLLKKGVILVYCENIEGMKVDGVTFLLEDKIPVIGMSLRYSRLDYYWFTLFHELSHIIRHKELLSEPLLDDLDEDSQEEIEIEADTLAKDSFIPINKWRSCKLNYSSNDEVLKQEAIKFNLHPVILAGRFQRENHRYNIFSKIINSINVREILL